MSLLFALALLAPPWFDFLTPAENPIGVHLTDAPGGGYTVYWSIQDRAREPDPPSDGVGYTLYRGHLDRGGRLSKRAEVARRLTRIIARHGGQTVAAQSRNWGSPKGWRTALVLWTDGVAGERRVELPVLGRIHGQGGVFAAWAPAAGRWAVAWEQQHDIDPARPGYVYSRLVYGHLDREGGWHGVRFSSGDRDPAVDRLSVGFAYGSEGLVATPAGPALSWIRSGEKSSTLLVSRPDAAKSPPVVIDTAERFGRVSTASDARGAVAIIWARSPTGVVLDPDDRYPGLEPVEMRAAVVRGDRVIQLGRIGGHGDISRVASDGRAFLAAWYAMTDGAEEIHLARLVPDAEGYAVDGWQMTRSRAGFHNWPAHLHFDGARYLLGVTHDINPSQYRLYTIDPARPDRRPFNIDPRVGGVAHPVERAAPKRPRAPSIATDEPAPR